MQELPTQKPHIAIKHILKRLKPARLRERMKDIIEWRRDEGFEKFFGAFMRELARQAKRLEEEKESERGLARPIESYSSSEEKTQVRKQKRKNSKQHIWERCSDKKWPKSVGYPNEARWNSHLKQGADNKANNELPPCFNPECDGFYFIAQCPISIMAQKAKYRTEYKARKRLEREARSVGQRREPMKKGQIHRIGAEEIDSHSALFSATFRQDAVEVVLMADQGSDVNLIPEDILKTVQSSAPGREVRELNPPHVYTGIGKTSGEVCCTHQVVMDLYLRIRHGTRLVLRLIPWKNAKVKSESVIIGRHLLQAIGCDNKALLTAACDKHNRVINVPQAMEDDATRCISKDFYRALRFIVDQAKENGMSEEGLMELQKLIDEFKPILD
ncbi:unnamed protein product [Agarophyton chilense]